MQTVILSSLNWTLYQKNFSEAYKWDFTLSQGNRK